MDFFLKIALFGAIVLHGFGSCFSLDVVDEAHAKELSAIILYARDLKKIGLSHDVIVKEFSDLLLKDLAHQNEPAVSNKTLFYIGLAAVGIVLVGGAIYWFFNATQDNNEYGEIDAVNNPRVDGVNYNVVGGDIVLQHFNDDNTGAIVNAANEALQGGGGVDGGVHQAAGAEQLRQFCRDNFAVNAQGNRLNPGQAVITPGFNLAPQRIIHTIAPRAYNDPQWRNTLAQAYQNSMRVAHENNLNAVAFPALGTGIFGCDPAISARIAVRTVNRYLAEHPGSQINEVRFVCWGDNVQRYQNELALLNP